MPELTLSASVIGLIIMAVSFFKIYRVKNITVAYKDQYGKIRGYEIKDIYNLTDPWINVETVEAYIAEKKKLQCVKVVRIKIKSGLVLRRA